MEQASVSEPSAVQLTELVCVSSVARKVQYPHAEMSDTHPQKRGAAMLDEMLMFGAGAMALAVIGTLVAAFFALERRTRVNRTKPERKTS
jgi:hypothetical protein